MNDQKHESSLTTREAFESLTQTDMELIALKATVEQQAKLIESYRKDAERYRFIIDCPIRTMVALSRKAHEDDFDLSAECDRLLAKRVKP
ncbi:MAG: hypothetical protein M3Q94_10990 [Pseudomonadota bacterium]|nr:hypothetical protein [Pseudomonadota bacterium]